VRVDEVAARRRLGRLEGRAAEADRAEQPLLDELLVRCARHFGHDRAEERVGEVGVVVPGARLEDLLGGVPEHNARLMRGLLAGTGGPLRDIVLLNSGAALLVAGKAATLEEGIELAARSLDSGAAQRVLENLVARTNTPAAAEATAK